MYLEERLIEIEEKLDALLRNDDLRIMTPQDVADMVGIPLSTLYKTKRFLLPPYEGTGPMSWTKKEVKDYLAKGIGVLEREYKERGGKIRG